MANVWGIGGGWTRIWWGAVVTLALMVGGCSGGGQAASPSAAAPTAMPPTPTPAPISLGGVVWTTSVDDATGAPDENLQVIAYDAPAIIAAVETGPLGAGTTLTGQWMMNGVAVPGQPTTVRAEADREGGWVAFTLRRNEGMTWPPGVLEITIAADDGTTVSGSVQIQVNQ